MSTFNFFKKYTLIPFLVSVGALIVMSAGIYVLFIRNSEYAMQLYAQIAEAFDEKDILDDAGNASFTGLFLNNLKATASSALMGIVPFFFLPALVLIVNAGVMGVIFAVIGSMGENIWGYFVCGILPHGIFEIPAICLGTALGLMICMFECSKIRGKGWLCDFKAGEFFTHVLKIFVIVCIPLLVIAAFVESTITPEIMDMFLTEF